MAVAIMYGGGQIPEGNSCCGFLAETLMHMPEEETVYGIHKSFLGLINEECYEHLTHQKATQMQKTIGTYLGTCRNVRLNKEEHLQALSILKAHNISTIFLCGGDGSLRAANDFINDCNNEVNFIFIPCSIDGMNGTKALGVKNAVAESYRVVKQISSGFFSTFYPNFKGPRVAGIELQGRNRDDILLKTCKSILSQKYLGHTSVDEMKIIIIPAGYNWNVESVVNKINSTDKPTLVLMSEGAIPKGKKEPQGIESIANAVNATGIRTMSTFKVAHLSQINATTNYEEYIHYCNFAVQWYLFNKNSNKSAVVCHLQKRYTVKPLADIIAMNPNSKDPIPLSQKAHKKFEPYLP